MELLLSEEGLPLEKITEYMEKAGDYCLEKEGIDPTKADVSVTFVEPEEIQELNRTYRDKDAVTDVLSFPQFEDLSELDELDEICLGDVVICLERAKEQAEEFGHSLEREILYLYVHSIYHLLGYDHETDEEREEMRQLEEAAMSFIGLER